MKFSLSWIQDYIPNIKLQPERVARFLTMHSFEVEAVEKSGRDWVLDIAVPTNRADCMSHIGIARECAAILNVKLKTKSEKSQLKTKNFKTQDFIKVEVQAKNDCSRYTARAVANVRVGPSPKWMQERLRACGLQPINNVVDVANYVMLETGQPLHAFDLDKIEGGNSKSEIRNPKQIQNSKFKIQKLILVRRAKRGEQITSLDGQKYDLDESILLIADGKDPLAIAGVKGGKKAEIDSKTKTIIIESANFNPASIRFASRRLDLKTDASTRFEHGIDANLTELALNRAAELISILARGDMAQGIADLYPKKVAPKRIKVALDRAEGLLGVKISPKEIKDILARLGFKIENWQGRVFTVIVPTLRKDIFLPEDIIEEIGRIYGYEKIPPSLPRYALIPSKRNDDVFWQGAAKNALKESGFTEVYNCSFIGEKEAEIFGKNYWVNLCEIENPVSLEYKYLAPSLAPNLLKNIARNQKRSPDIKIFELGKVFHPDFTERRMLTGVLTGESFYLAKGVLDSLFQAMGLSDLWYDEYNPTPEESPYPWWQTGKSAEIKTEKGEELGFLGYIDTELLEDLDIKGQVAVFEIDFEKLQKLATEEYIYRPVSKYPAAVRDVAILVPQFTKVDDVLNVIENAGGKLVADVDLFDMYEGEDLPAGRQGLQEGKKNLAFHIVYQAEDHTLTSQEIDLAHNKIILALEANADWEVRK